MSSRRLWKEKDVILSLKEKIVKVTIINPRSQWKMQEIFSKIQTKLKVKISNKNTMFKDHRKIQKLR